MITSAGMLGQGPRVEANPLSGQAPQGNHNRLEAYQNQPVDGRIQQETLAAATQPEQIDPATEVAARLYRAVQTVASKSGAKVNLSPNADIEQTLDHILSLDGTLRTETISEVIEALSGIANSAVSHKHNEAFNTTAIDTLGKLAASPEESVAKSAIQQLTNMVNGNFFGGYGVPVHEENRFVPMIQEMASKALEAAAQSNPRMITEGLFSGSYFGVSQDALHSILTAAVTANASDTVSAIEGKLSSFLTTHRYQLDSLARELSTLTTTRNVLGSANLANVERAQPTLARIDKLIAEKNQQLSASTVAETTEPSNPVASSTIKEVATPQTINTMAAGNTIDAASLQNQTPAPQGSFNMDTGAIGSSLVSGQAAPAQQPPSAPTGQLPQQQFQAQ